MISSRSFILTLILGILFLNGCVTTREKPVQKIPLIFDTDTNNELDDQHALAYLLFNGGIFDLVGVTINATRSGGAIENHYKEAERVMRLCGYHSDLPLYSGADQSFDSIQNDISKKDFDGHIAVDFIIEEAKNYGDGKLIVLAVGKLTNVALALKKDPSIVSNIRVVWLGSNYPEPGEYNLDNDTASLNYVLKTTVEFEMVTVRYAQTTGSGAVSVTQEEINKKMPQLGPEIVIPVVGRHGREFSSFGDYSVDLFEHIDYHGNPPSRSLFDMVAVAIVKNPTWGTKKQIPAPLYIGNKWVQQRKNPRIISVWENFDKESILADFYETLENYQLAE
jgi:inosine-uridine nucleoside N-ribohydrolase